MSKSKIVYNIKRTINIYTSLQLTPPNDGK